MAAVDASDTPRTRTSLTADLRALGLAESGVLLVHSSLSSLGWVCGSAVAVVGALLDALAPEGTLVVPTHTTGNSDPAAWANPPIPQGWWATVREHMPAFDPLLTPSSGMGAVAELVRTWPGPCAANTRRRRLPRSARTPSGSLPATPWRAGWESTHRSDASTTSTRRSCCSASATPRQQQLVSPGRVPRAHTAAPSDGRGRQHVVGPSVDRLRRRRSRRRRLRGPRRRVRCNGSHTQWPRRRGHRPRAPPTRRSRLRRRLAHAPPTLTSPTPPDAPQPQQFMDEAVRSLSTRPPGPTPRALRAKR